MKQHFRSALFAHSIFCLTLLCLGGCSESSDQDKTGYQNTPPIITPVENTPPVITPFSKQSIGETQQKTIKAVVDDDKGPLQFKWEQTKGNKAEIAGVDTDTLTITAPFVDSTTELEFTLTVTDEGGLKDTSSVLLQIDPAPVIRGQVFKGPVSGSQVTAYQSNGAEIGKATTDENGHYQFKNYALYQGVVQLEATGGHYVNEASDKIIELEQPLHAVSNISANDSTMNITLLTELATRRAKTLSPELSPESVQAANQEVAQAFSLDFDIVQQAPLDLLDSTNLGQYGHSADYALIMAGSMFAVQNGTSTLNTILDSMASDLNNNGMLNNVALLNALNSGVNDFLSSPQNRAGITEQSTALDSTFYRNTPPILTLSHDKLTVIAGEKVEVSSQVKDDKGEVAYYWLKLKGPWVHYNDSSTLTFTAPNVDKITEFIFKLTARDQGGLKDSKQVTVTVNPSPKVDLSLIQDPGLRKCLSQYPILNRDIRQIRTLNCRGTSVIQSLQGIEQLKYLSTLSIYAPNNITDLTPLSALKELRRLRITNNTVLTDISPLNGLPLLSSLTIENNPALVDFSAIAEITTLTVLNLSGTEIDDTDTAVLQNLSNLKYLSFNNTAIENTDFLQYLPNLETLKISNTAVKDIGFLQRYPNLTSLDVSQSPISNVVLPTNIPNLKKLDIANTSVSDISFLRNISNLTSLNLSNTSVRQIDELKNLSNLHTLGLINLELVDIQALTGLESITELNISNNNIVDLRPLSGLTSLRYLNISDNPISELSPISGLTKLSRLRLNSLPIFDLNALTAMDELSSLYLNNSKVKDISALSNKLFLSYIEMQNVDGTDLAPLVELGQLEKARLRRVDLRGSQNILCSQIKQLRDARISTGIYTDLGVTCQP